MLSSPTSRCYSCSPSLFFIGSLMALGISSYTRVFFYFNIASVPCRDPCGRALLCEPLNTTDTRVFALGKCYETYACTFIALSDAFLLFLYTPFWCFHSFVRQPVLRFHSLCLFKSPAGANACTQCECVGESCCS